MPPDERPLLYSFRRCPYAIRARLALLFSDTDSRVCEVSLKNKPEEMLAISPKGTVPVLQLADGSVIEESLDIVLWALKRNDPQALLPRGDQLKVELALISVNDGEFKHWLDRYKYADRHPEQTAEAYRNHGEVYLQRLDDQLKDAAYLTGTKPSLADIAILPFIRQFAHVDRDWFYGADYPHLQEWLQRWLASPEFQHVMKKTSASTRLHCS